MGWESEGAVQEEDGGTGGGAKKKFTYGIDIKDLKISGGNETYHIWDYSGDLNSYSSHSHFFSSSHTMYILVLDLHQSLPQLRSEILYWLGIIKMRNLGKVMPYIHRERLDTARLSPKLQQRGGGGVAKGGTLSRVRTVSVPAVMKFRSRLYSSSSGSYGPSLKPPKTMTRSSSPSVLSPAQPPRTSSPGASPGDATLSPIVSPSSPLSPFSVMEDSSSWSSVPVIVVGSHYDLLPEAHRVEVVQNVEGFMGEISSRFYPFLEVLPRMLYMNCLKPSNSDIKLLKEQIILFRAVQAEVSLICQSKYMYTSPLSLSLSLQNEQSYPAIFDKVIKKIESIRQQSPERKASFRFIIK